MALVIRYFSTTAAGAGDGTTWADRAALFSAGVWSSVITGFTFNGSDAMEARIGPGTYACGAQISFSVASPTAGNYLALVACDTNGDRLTVPDPDWVSSEPVWDTSNMPVIATTTNINTINSANVNLRLIRFTASGRFGTVIALAGAIDWCAIENTYNHASSAGVGNFLAMTNCFVDMSGASFASGVTLPSSITAHNVRVDGNAGSGIGFIMSSSGQLNKCTAWQCGGGGIDVTSASAAVAPRIDRCVVVNCAGDGIDGTAVASQTSAARVEACVITGNTGYGIDAGSSRFIVSRCRARDNSSGNFGNFGNYPTDIENITSASTDSADYVDASSGDFRIKYGSAAWGLELGAGDGPATITG